MNRVSTLSTVTATTKNKNRYLFDRRLKKNMICHPLLFFFAKLKETGELPDLWMAQQSGETIQIEDLGAFSRADVTYYYKKFQILSDNGFFSEIPQREMVSAVLTADDVKSVLANLRQITFELTDACNLKCAYCGFGQYYENLERTGKKFIDVTAAKQLIDYLKEFLDSPLNLSSGRKTFIGFYGGEPLLNFPFIHEIVRYVNGLNWQNFDFIFTITTNGLLLNEYMEFLVEHNFNTFISLDGDEKNNGYRVFHNGLSAYNTIFNNVELLRLKYPDYFAERVQFNAVLHNKNSVAEIFHYFSDHFDKKPAILPLNTSDIREDQADNFWKTYVNFEESLHNAEDYSRINQEMFIKLPSIQELSTFITQVNDFCVNDYTGFFANSDQPKRTPSGTCFPFSKKLFVTASGDILACERISQSFVLGHMGSEGVSLDLQAIADQYNQWFDRLRKQCGACYYLAQCVQCIFYLDLTDKNTICNRQMTISQYSQYHGAKLEFLEENPLLFNRILKEVIIS